MEAKLIKIGQFIKRRWLLLSVIVLLAIVIIFSIGGNGSKVATATVERGTVTSEVSVTGNVKSAQSLDIAFESGGRMGSVKVKVGDKVSQGEILVVLESADIAAQVAQAQAQLKSQQSRLNQLKRGARPEDIQIQRLGLQKDQEDLTGYYSNAVGVINDAYAKSNDAVNQQIDGMFYGATSDTPTLSFLPDNTQLKTAIETQRLVVTKEMNDWTGEMSGLSLSSAPDFILQSLDDSQNHITVIRSFLNALLNVVNNSGSLAAATLTAYKTNINIGLTNLNIAASSTATQEQMIVSQKLLVQKTQDELNLEIAGSDPEDISYQEGQVGDAQASLAYYQAQLAKTIIKAPFDGTVTKIVPEIGDIVRANDPVISLVGKGQYQIEANIAESDIARVKIGNKASVTLDAYGPSVVFEATVIKIDLSATIIEGVATYKTTLQFTQEDSRILPGLTANVDILSDKRENVLYVPTRDIIDQDGQKFVKIMSGLNDKNPRQIKAEIGLVGSDGRTEIVSGVKEGNIILAE